MSKLTDTDVKHVAHLAKLDLTDAELRKFQPQLENIIDHISVLSEVDTDGIEPTSQTTGLKNIFRDDIYKGNLSQEDALSGSENVYNGYFKVKAVLKGRTDK